MTKEKFNRPNSIMLVAAHPDDLEMSCGGTIAKWVSQGTRAYALIVTNGDKGGKRNTLTSSQLAVVREHEERRASQVLGVEEIEFLGKSDGSLQYSDELRGEIVRWIRKWRPEALATHDSSPMIFDWGEINHPDHLIVGALAMHAIRPFASGRLFYPEQLLEPGIAVHSVRHLLLWDSDKPNHWEDIQGFIPSKVAAAACHETQYPNMEPVESWIYRRSQETGRVGGFEQAECFKHVDLCPSF